LALSRPVAIDDNRMKGFGSALGRRKKRKRKIKMGERKSRIIDFCFALPACSGAS